MSRRLTAIGWGRLSEAAKLQHVLALEEEIQRLQRQLDTAIGALVEEGEVIGRLRAQVYALEGQLTGAVREVEQATERHAERLRLVVEGPGGGPRLPCLDYLAAEDLDAEASAELTVAYSIWRNP